MSKIKCANDAFHLQVTLSAGFWDFLLAHLCFSEQELQISSAEDAVVLDVAREVHGAGAVDGAVNFHVAVDDVQVFLFILEQRRE